MLLPGAAGRLSPQGRERALGPRLEKAHEGPPRGAERPALLPEPRRRRRGRRLGRPVRGPGRPLRDHPIDPRSSDGRAKKAGVALIPDCGVSPGTCNVLAAAGIARLDRADEVHIYCGGLPQTPRPPLNYKLVFNLEGVIGNYLGKAYVLRDGEIAKDAPLSRRQTLDFDPPLGRLEAAVTGGATATAPWTYRGKIRAYDYKTLRYPGHWDKIETLRDLGLLDEKPVLVKGRGVSPRDVFVACAEGRLKFPDDRDLLVQRVIVIGKDKARPARAIPTTSWITRTRPRGSPPCSAPPASPPPSSWPCWPRAGSRRGACCRSKTRRPAGALHPGAPPPGDRRQGNFGGRPCLRRSRKRAPTTLSTASWRGRDRRACRRLL